VISRVDPSLVITRNVVHLKQRVGILHVRVDICALVTALAMRLLARLSSVVSLKIHVRMSNVARGPSKFMMGFVAQPSAQTSSAVHKKALAQILSVPMGSL